ncbi:hypothetical protein N7466_000602 [Penicillium verhagenii]|uniref:uncharacterized protein n=1 Tax=Penicillium verhagenii TaxID=1562060 RepID=UPI0025459428|nr:uncharacterized protein N7466_000602 [Penicillium verhagenii]KAJ5947587.1 hypothetical protein N7466_000602 [Penicillium verhagenii]
MTLLQFLRQARQVHLQFLAGTLSEPPIYVLGNPSADLDSIISAILYSYCANNRLPTTTPRPHIPLLNLPNIPAGPELYRLRPEFVTALWLSTNSPALSPDEQFDDSSHSAGSFLREHILTTADFAQNLKDRVQHSSSASKLDLLVDAILVDWNALPERVDGAPGQGSLGGVLSQVIFRVVGCIDHHVDEKFMPPAADLPDDQPLIIQSGPGSCASLITDEMQKRGFWGTDAGAGAAAEMAQVAKLALAPILIDTSNLTAEGKVTDVDVKAVEFLRPRAAGGEERSWNMQKFYEAILSAKQNSLDRLTLHEVLDRDYKEWTETVGSSDLGITLGFCSSVKPIRWVVEKAGGPQQFLNGVRSFASSEGKELDVVVVMTSFTSSEGEFSRELFIGVVGDHVAIKGIESFVAHAGSHLGLSEWMAVDGEAGNSPEEEDIRTTLNGEKGLWRALWIQKDTKASRKQVAPLLRGAVSKL